MTPLFENLAKLFPQPGSTIEKILRMTDITQTLQQKLEDLLLQRYPKTLCPSEIPRSFNCDELNELGALTWRDLMPYMRDIVWDLRESRRVDVLQGGNVITGFVKLSEVKGPIRVRMRPGV